MNAFSTPAEVDDRNNGEFVYFKNVPQRLDYEGNLVEQPNISTAAYGHSWKWRFYKALSETSGKPWGKYIEYRCPRQRDLVAAAAHGKRCPRQRELVAAAAHGCCK
jgi:hypothetical protein